MRGAGERYQRYIGKRTGKFATWEPGDRVELGDIGTIVKGHFRADTNLRKLGVDWRSEQGTLQPEVSHSSVKSSLTRGGVQADAGAAVATMEIEFEHAGSVVFEAKNIRHVRISDFRRVEQAILELHAAGQWQKQWLVVDAIWQAETATILVSKVAGTRIGVTLDGAPKLSSLVDTEFGLEVRAGEISRVARATKVNPLYTCRRLNWSGSKTRPVSNAEPEVGGDADRFHACELDELLQSWDDEHGATLPG